ncbi:MAG: peptidylprolyl isomerase [Gammaproteobacteria bacterium]|nr:peptidylprolyl isomerase [Gammaproteobacteria bacterium]
MQITAKKVVTIDYTLTDEQGQVIDSSQGRDPLAYLHGFSNIIPGLESALEGRTSGDALNVKVAPTEAYGERDDALIQSVSRDLFEDANELEVGMRFQSVSEDGVRLVTVVDVTDDTVTVDANHPLAGVTLTFDVTVVDVRDANDEELEHGHVHGPEGHHHD